MNQQNNTTDGKRYKVIFLGDDTISMTQRIYKSREIAVEVADVIPEFYDASDTQVVELPPDGNFIAVVAEEGSIEDVQVCATEEEAKTFIHAFLEQEEDPDGDYFMNEILEITPDGNYQ